MAQIKADHAAHDFAKMRRAIDIGMNIVGKPGCFTEKGRVQIDQFCPRFKRNLPQDRDLLFDYFIINSIVTFTAGIGSARMTRGLAESARNDSIIARASLRIHP